MMHTLDELLERIYGQSYGQNRDRRRLWGLVLCVRLRLESGPNGSKPRVDPPRLYQPVGKLEDRHAVTYAVWGLHWILRGWRWWGWHRWELELLLFEIGWMEGDHWEAPMYRSLRFGDPRRIIRDRIQKRVSTAHVARNYAIERAREEGARAGSQLTAIQLEELRKLVKDVAFAKAGYSAHALSFGALVSISLALPGDSAGEVDDYDEVVRRVVDVVEELDRYKAAAAIAAESTVGLGR